MLLWIRKRNSEMRDGLVAGGVVLVMGLAAFAGEPNKTAEAVKELQGEWVGVEGAEDGGRKLPEELVKQLRLTFRGNRLTFGPGSQNGGVEFKLEPSKKPKEIDLISLDGPLKGKVVPG